MRLEAMKDMVKRAIKNGNKEEIENLNKETESKGSEEKVKEESPKTLPSVEEI